MSTTTTYTHFEHTHTCPLLCHARYLRPLSTKCARDPWRNTHSTYNTAQYTIYSLNKAHFSREMRRQKKCAPATTSLIIIRSRCREHARTHERTHKCTRAHRTYTQRSAEIFAQIYILWRATAGNDGGGGGECVQRACVRAMCATDGQRRRHTTRARI